jgi:2-(1,2-epoxy-1,2-dihydrophenyl)acetyl-CoA isomerase
MSEAQTLARRLADGSANALAHTKRALNASETNCFDAQLDLERDYQQSCGKSVDYREGAAAFIAKRTPRFSRD